MADKETFSFIPTDRIPFGDRFEVGGTLFSATTKTSRRFIVEDLADLIRQAKASAGKRPDSQAKQNAIVLGVPIDVTPDPPVDPPVETDEDKALKAWRVADGKAQAALRKVATGYVRADAPEVVKLVDEARALYQPEFLVL